MMITNLAEVYLSQLVLFVFLVAHIKKDVGIVKRIIDIVRVSEYNIHMADLAVDVQDDQSAKSFVTPCSCAGRFLSLWRCLYGVYVYCGSRSEMEYIE